MGTLCSSLPVENLLISGTSRSPESNIKECLIGQIGAGKFREDGSANPSRRRSEDDTAHPRHNRGRIDHNLTRHPAVESTVVRNGRADWSCLDGKTCSRRHDARIKAAIIGDNAMQELIIVVKGNGFTGLGPNSRGYEEVVLHYPFRNCAAAAREVQVWTEHVIPLSANIPRGRGQRKAPSGQMA